MLERGTEKASAGGFYGSRFSGMAIFILTAVSTSKHNFFLSSAHGFRNRLCGVPRSFHSAAQAVRPTVIGILF